MRPKITATELQLLTTMVLEYPRLARAHFVSITSHTANGKTVLCLLYRGKLRRERVLHYTKDTLTTAEKTAIRALHPDRTNAELVTPTELQAWADRRSL